MKGLLLGILIWPILAIAEPYYVAHGAPGLFTEVNKAIIDLIYLDTGVEPVYIEEETSRGLISANEGRASAALYRVKSAAQQYPNLLPLDQPHYVVQIHAFSKQGIAITEWRHLADYKIAYLSGFVAAERQTRGYQRLETKSLAQAFQLLQANRVDLLVASRDSGLEYMQKNSIRDIQMYEHPLAKVPLFHFIHKRHQSLLPALNLNLQQQLENGQIQRTIEQILGLSTSHD